MSDSGRQIGDCIHSASRYHCATCLRTAITQHWAQRADDRCILDDDTLYAAAGLPAPDRRVGDKFAMAKNCIRFIDIRCESGGWPSYVELEAEIERLKAMNQALAERVAAQSELLAKRAEKSP